MCNIEDPVTTPSRHAVLGGETTTTHPSFAQIVASRVSGHTNLYDSDFQHNAFITVTISRSELHRGLSYDRHHGKEELIEVAMSEVQWASFVSSMNVGSGVPCTIQHIARERVPQLPNPGSRDKQFGEEMRRTVSESIKALNELSASVDALGLSQKKADALKMKIHVATSHLSNNAEFVASQFDEHMEGTVERAKAEVHGYVSGVVSRAGISSLSSQAPFLIEDGRDD
jgi:hypothetical protein